MKLFMIMIVILAFVTVEATFPTSDPITLILRMMGTVGLFSYVAWLGSIVGFYKGADAERERQQRETK